MHLGLYDTLQQYVQIGEIIRLLVFGDFAQVGGFTEGTGAVHYVTIGNLDCVVIFGAFPTTAVDAFEHRYDLKDDIMRSIFFLIMLASLRRSCGISQRKARIPVVDKRLPYLRSYIV